MEVSKGQWQGHPRRVERPLPFSFSLETGFICFLNLNPGRFFTLRQIAFTLLLDSRCFFMIEMAFGDRSFMAMFDSDSFASHTVM